MARSRSLLFGAAFGVAALAISPMALGSPGHGAGSAAAGRVSGPTPFSAGCNGPNPLVAAYVNAEVEPYVAADPRNPRHLISVYQQDRYPNDGANGVLASVSTNGGRSWTIPPLGKQPTFSRCSGGNAANGGDFEKATDPWIDIAPDGTAYFANVGYNDSNADTAEFVATSTDGGRSWNAPKTLIRENDPNVIDDRAAVTADRIMPHTAYVVWARQVNGPASAAGGAAYFSRTTDGGATWSTARPIYQTPQGMETSANQIVELPNGDLLNIFNQLSLGQTPYPRHDAILEIRSTDHGLTWSKPETVATNFVAGVTDPANGKPIRVGDNFTHIAVDPRPGTQTVYAVWGDSRFTNGGSEQIAFAKSTDGGQTWTAPTRVSTGAAGAFVPGVAVNSAGVVGVAYYQLTGDDPAEPLATRYWIATSADGGSHWATRRQLSRQTFDLRTAPYDGGYFLGEYEGFTAAGTDFVATATLTNGRSLTDPTDIYAVTYHPPGR